MAKSTNHTAHNQSYKNHRNGACQALDPGPRCFFTRTEAVRQDDAETPPHRAWAIVQEA